MDCKAGFSTAYLPPNVPELNPVEYIWGYWKQHELPNAADKIYDTYLAELKKEGLL
jgi:transposase